MIAVITLSLLLQVDAHQTPLRAPATQPYEGSWVVEVIDNIKVMPDSRVTMTIRRDANAGSASVSGAGPCNTYRGSFTVDADGVRVGQLLKTMKACDAPRMSEEADFFALLNAVVRYEVQKDRLVLTTRDGKSMTARRAPDSSSRR
jgi:heat shock protein HslJ